MTLMSNNHSTHTAIIIKLTFPWHAFLLKINSAYYHCRLVEIMLKNLIIILFRISPKKLTLCLFYSQNVLIFLKIIPDQNAHEDLKAVKTANI